MALECWRRPGRFGGLGVEPVHGIWRLCVRGTQYLNDHKQEKEELL
jgi:hypothetical protein